MTARRKREIAHFLALAMAKAPALPGIAQTPLRDALNAMAARPMRGGSQDMEHGGLFGDAMKQKELF